MKTLPAEVGRRIIGIQVLTLIWMAVEAAVSLGAAWTARSPALLSFGGDSAVELLSAVVVLRRFSGRSPQAHAEKQEAKIAGALLFVLAAFVILASTLSLLRLLAEPRPSLAGIVLLILAALVMPWLARQKRLLSVATASAALRTDATESAICGYLALIALAGLAANAIWKVNWADPVAALALLPFILHEGWQAMKGKPCCDEVRSTTHKSLNLAFGITSMVVIIIASGNREPLMSQQSTPSVKNRGVSASRKDSSGKAVQDLTEQINDLKSHPSA